METYPAVFLDRDGVIIENRDDYVRSWRDVAFYPETFIALAKLAETPYKIIIVTNQSAVGRGVIDLRSAELINQGIQSTIEASGGRIDAVFMCPHAPQEGCGCRKPKPGMLLQAASRMSIDLSHSIMIGDGLEDIQAGLAAGVARRILVLTGRGTAQFALSQLAPGLGPFEVNQSLSGAIRLILNE